MLVLPEVDLNPPKRRRGRPRKVNPEKNNNSMKVILDKMKNNSYPRFSNSVHESSSKAAGQIGTEISFNSKPETTEIQVFTEADLNPPKRGRGRPRKVNPEISYCLMKVIPDKIENNSCPQFLKAVHESSGKATGQIKNDIPINSMSITAGKIQVFAGADLNPPKRGRGHPRKVKSEKINCPMKGISTTGPVKGKFETNESEMNAQKEKKKLIERKRRAEFTESCRALQKIIPKLLEVEKRGKRIPIDVVIDSATERIEELKAEILELTRRTEERHDALKFASAQEMTKGTNTRQTVSTEV